MDIKDYQDKALKAAAGYLEAPSYPRLFGCVGLQRVADTDEPKSVGAILKAAWPRRQLI